MQAAGILDIKETYTYTLGFSSREVSLRNRQKIRVSTGRSEANLNPVSTCSESSLFF
jgi:hypothetical protein